jgi:hypothetical protein
LLGEGTGERVEAVAFLVKEQFKVKGVEMFMGLAMAEKGQSADISNNHVLE